MSKSFTVKLKAKVAHETTGGDRTVSKLVFRYEVHPNQIC